MTRPKPTKTKKDGAAEAGQREPKSSAASITRQAPGMLRNRRQTCLLVTGAMLTAAAGSTRAKTPASPSLEAIIDRHTRARGGAAALDSVHGLETEIWITEKAATIVGQYRCTDQPAFRIDIFDGAQHVFCEGLDADGPWIWPGAAAEPKQGVADAKRTALEGIEFNLYGLHAFRRRGSQLGLVGREIIQGVNHFVLQVDLKDSYRTFLYIDPQTWMIARRRDMRAFHPDVDQAKAPVETQYEDFRTVSGIVKPFVEHLVDLRSGNITQLTAVKRMVCNPALDPGLMNRSYPPPSRQTPAG